MKNMRQPKNADQLTYGGKLQNRGEGKQDLEEYVEDYTCKRGHKLMCLKICRVNFMVCVLLPKHFLMYFYRKERSYLPQFYSTL